ncbi:hypothetical protein [Roseivirga sp. E12]|uniref:hypothetical protein n=1 Tax=Roseivirga sp. E12 TaxID=2819237 RepID=UPI001ABD2D0E|nr:hypothetical protein [Roseivirga sp. E12]MBO3696913.1 hypothetical protein [Roseivirga sp. E12]
MVNLKLNWKYCLALYCITMLYASLHELVHHFVGFLVCGDWGYKTFNSFVTTCDGTPKSYIATYAGPVFSFIMMYVGAYFLKKRSSTFHNHLGFALIFAQMPAQRMSGPILGFNDELYATSRLFEGGINTQIIVTIILFAICIPPLITAFKAIKNKRRILWFLLYFLFLPYILFGPPFVLLEYLMVQKGILDEAIIGIATLFIINELFTIGLYFKVKKYINPFYKSNASI